jgi:hypothetical protein
MTNNTKTGGVLSIVAGGIGVLSMLTLVLVAVFMAVMPSLFGDDFYSAQSYSSDEISAQVVFIIIAAIYGGMGFIGMLIAALAVVGGVFTLKRRYWGWALAGAIAGNLVFPPCGIPALIFTCLGKNEFQSAAPSTPPAPVHTIVG